MVPVYYMQFELSLFFTLWFLDLYKDLLAPRFKSSLFVQSWQSGGGGKMHSNCTGNHEVCIDIPMKYM
jgi:hypothetical protein